MKKERKEETRNRGTVNEKKEETGDGGSREGG